MNCATTGAQLRDNPEEREKCGKSAKKHQQPHRHTHRHKSPKQNCICGTPCSTPSKHVTDALNTKKEHVNTQLRRPASTSTTLLTPKKNTSTPDRRPASTSTTLLTPKKNTSTPSSDAQQARQRHQLQNPITAFSQGRPHLVDELQTRDIDHFGSTATAEPPLFSALTEPSPAPVVEKQQACQELRCGIRASSAQFAL